MKIEVAKSAGFCFGVKRAVEEAYKCAENKNEKYYTFGPIIHNGSVVEDLKKHKVESEQISISQQVVDAVDKAHASSKNVCAVGTEIMRALEHVVGTSGQIKAYDGWTNKFIYAPYDFTVANSFLVNFYMPQSTQLIMVATFGGYDYVMKAYKEAIKEGYRFGDYGDAMLILND